MASLLKSLASAINKDVVIQGIHTRGLQVLVTGVSATSQGPANYIQHLNESVAATGWRASLAGREATLIHSDGGPWTFSVELSPVPVIGSNALTTAARRIK